MWSFIFQFCCYAPSLISSIFAVSPVVNLSYAQYQGVPTLDPVNNETITHFLGIRYAAAPTGKVFTLLRVVYPSYTVKTGSRRFSEPQLPSYTPGVQLANKQPSECFQAGVGTAPKTPFRNAVPNLNTSLTSVNSTELAIEGSEDCLFLKYIFMFIDICHLLTTTVVPVSTFLVSWEKRRTCLLFSIYTGIY